MTLTTIINALRVQITSCETQLAELQQQLADAELQQQEAERGSERRSYGVLRADPFQHDFEHGVHEDFRSEIWTALGQGLGGDETGGNEEQKWPLTHREYKRYGRQLIMPEVGLAGQLRLKKASVLVVGVGGLGCPAAAYLVGAGVGTIGLIDGDIVEESNLHRQILHSTPRVGMSKVDSAIVALSSSNPNVKLIPHHDRLAPESALSIMEPYDLVLDCTDTPASRYLISDACVLLSKPLVSASALRTEGQLMVLNNPPLSPGSPSGGPCYRCVFPKPPPPESVISCGDGGILGPVVGVMGVLQALEALKLLARPPTQAADSPSLLIFSAYSSPQFRTVRLRTRKPKCAACSATASVTPAALNSGSLDYVQFCGAVASVDALGSSERVSAENYARIRNERNPFSGLAPNTNTHILVDVREQVQFELCSLSNSINIPFSEITRTRRPQPATKENAMDVDDAQEPWIENLKQSPEKPVFVVCRLGNDSQVAVRMMKDAGLDFGGKRFVGDVRGGLKAWREKVDGEFPDY